MKLVDDFTKFALLLQFGDRNLAESNIFVIQLQEYNTP